jgi:hypothetical protein
MVRPGLRQIIAAAGAISAAAKAGAPLVCRTSHRMTIVKANAAVHTATICPPTRRWSSRESKNT